MHVAVLGTGVMGTGIAMSLLRAGHQVTVWNRNAARTDRARIAGATVRPTPRAAVADADAVFLVLFDAASVTEVITQASIDNPTDAVWVQMSTVGVDGTDQILQLAQRQPISIVEAMMLGTKGPAEKGELTLLTAGRPELLNELTGVFDAIATRVINVGPQLGRATALKLAVNAWILSLTALVGQSLAITQALGLDPQLFLKAVEGNATNNAYAQIKGKAMLDQNYEPSFPIEGGLKDLHLIRTAMTAVGVPNNVLDAVTASYATASRAGHHNDDLSAVRVAFDPNQH